MIILANRDFLVNSFGENILNLSDPLSLAKGSSHRTDGTEGVIMHISEESAAAVRKTVKRHQGNRFFALYHIAAPPAFSYGIFTKALNDGVWKSS